MSLMNELGEHLINHPQVAEVCVLPAGTGNPDDLVAFVVPGTGAKLTKEKLLKHAREVLAKSGGTLDALFLEEIPRTHMGSVDRPALMDLYAAARKQVA
ncbi:MAG: hypothetical protein GX580_00810 [Candidatus Hydrogenedens sp.]|nr:hypothetical protein [Candidatus Hydrogenedentota bacterium]NLF56160.1 hypothetical protein [Candidatus Hydrogenedens sp.]